MNVLRTALLLTLGLGLAIDAAVIPADRMVAWQGNVGIAGGIPSRTTIFTTLNPSGGDDTTTLRNALASCPAGQVVKLNAGTFRVTSTIDYFDIGSNKTLRGAGPGATIIRMDGGKFYVRGQFALPTTNVNLSSDAVKGSATVSVASVPSWVQVGHIYWISQLDDPAYCSPDGLEGGKCPLYYAGGTLRGMSQLNRVLAKTATTVTFEIPMYWNYATGRTAQIQKGFYNDAHLPRNLVGFEDLQMQGNYTDSDSDLIRFEGADSCWVKNCRLSNTPGRAGVYIDCSYRVEVRDSYIGCSHSYGGGDAYGVPLYNGSTACLIENNIFDHLHVGIALCGSAAGNVLAYNHFSDGFSDSGQNPTIASHQHHNWMNLIEGNYCSDKVSGDYTHGSGSHLTLFRNRILGKATSATTTPVVMQSYNRYANVVGNILGLANHHDGYDSAPSGAQYPLGTTRNVIYEIGDLAPRDSVLASRILRAVNAVYDSGSAASRLVLDGYQASDLPASYYLAGKPSWFGDRAWPPFDPTRASTAASTDIPAGYRFAHGANPPSGAPVANRAPVASAQNVTAIQGIAKALTLAASDADGNALTYAIVGNPTHGMLSGSGASRTYTPTASYAGADSFTFKVNDGIVDSNTATVSITVTAATSTNQAPTVSAVTATPSPVTGTTAGLSATASDDGGEPALTFSWSASGPAAVTFSPNGSNAAKASTATFAKAGSHTLTVTAKDAGNLTATRSVTVTVNATPTLSISPSGASVQPGMTVDFNALATDQFKVALGTQPTLAWSVSGGGTITANGLFTAGAGTPSPSGGIAATTYVVTASAGGANSTALVTVSTASASAGGGGGSPRCGGGSALALIGGLGLMLAWRRRR